MSIVDTKKLNFMNALKDGAIQSMHDSGIKESITLAQAAVESSWLTSQLAIQAKNVFGIKATSSWTGKILAMPTKEYVNGHIVTVDANWRCYDSYAASLADHANFFVVNPRYAKALAVKGDAAQFAAAIQAAGYSTNPGYADLLMAIIRSNNFQQFDSL